jgi:ribosomal protein S18 acetylase RimI-like enzyme
MIDIKAEGFFDCLSELQTLFPAHWQELGLFRNRMPLSPNWRVYSALETAGELLTVIARKDGKIIGYYVARICFGLHYASTITGQMDMMWIEKSFRNRGIGVKLFQVVETEMKNRKVEIWYSGSKVCGPHHKSMDKLLRWMDFEPVDLHYGKWIG